MLGQKTKKLKYTSNLLNLFPLKVTQKFSLTLDKAGTALESTRNGSCLSAEIQSLFSNMSVTEWKLAVPTGTGSAVQTGPPG